MQENQLSVEDHCQLDLTFLCTYDAVSGLQGPGSVQDWHSEPPSAFSTGAVGGRRLHEGGEGHCLAAVRGDDPDPHRGAAGGFPKTDEHREAAHLRGDRERAVRVSADGEALHGADHHQKQQYPGRPGNTPTFL